MRRIFAGGQQVLPVMIHLDVTLSQSVSSANEPLANRENDLDREGVALAIFGEGHWTNEERVRNFEVQCVPNQAGFWEGEISYSTRKKVVTRGKYSEVAFWLSA